MPRPKIAVSTGRRLMKRAHHFGIAGAGAHDHAKGVLLSSSQVPSTTAAATPSIVRR